MLTRGGGADGIKEDVQDAAPEGRVAVRAEPPRADGLALLLRVPLRRPWRLPQVLSRITLSLRKSPPPQNFRLIVHDY